jgi:hypothetical protein
MKAEIKLSEEEVYALIKEKLLEKVPQLNIVAVEERVEFDYFKGVTITVDLGLTELI